MASLGLVIVPAAFTMLTLDGTRVFAMLTLPAYIAVISHIFSADFEHVQLKEGLRSVGVGALLISPILPSIVTDNHGTIMSPFGQF